MGIAEGMEEILGIFFEEVNQNIEELERLFLGLRMDTPSSEFKVVFRIAHNIKGSAKSVGMANMGKVTHELETLLIKLGDGSVQLSPEMVNVLLRALDSLKTLLAHARETGTDALPVEEIVYAIKDIQQRAFDAQVAKAMNSAKDGDIIFITDVEPPSKDKSTAPEKTNSRLEEVTVVAPKAAVEAPKAAVEAPKAAVEAPKAAVEAPKAAVEAPKAAVEAPKAAVEAPKAAVAAPPAAAAAPSAARGISSASNETVRVPTHRIDRLQNHVGEILVLQSVLAEQLRDHPSKLVRNAMRQLKKVTREVQDDSMGLRLVSLKSLFMKLTRAVHDAANTLGKQVDLVTVGEDTEVDKVLSEGLADPLMHMVRNAVDHGLESTEDRLKSGKNSKGRIEISARSEGAFLVVRVKDDGKGLDTEAILAKARSKGIVQAGQDLTEKQIFSLIFQPSFSTKAVVTEVSGRGVGMDVVQTNVHAMRGHIDIESTRGQGSNFIISIPLAISLLDAMIVQIGSESCTEKWIIPLHMVVESFRLASCNLSFVTGVGDVMTLREENIPVVDLGRILQLRSLDADTASSERVVVIAKDKDVKIGLVVDTVLGIQTVVSKPLGAEMLAKPGISGCAILGDGKTSLILEVSNLHRTTSQSLRRAA